VGDGAVEALGEQAAGTQETDSTQVAPTETGDDGGGAAPADAVDAANDQTSTTDRTAEETEGAGEPVEAEMEGQGDAGDGLQDQDLPSTEQVTEGGMPTEAEAAATGEESSAEAVATEGDGDVAANVEGVERDNGDASEPAAGTSGTEAMPEPADQGAETEQGAEIQQGAGGEGGEEQVTSNEQSNSSAEMADITYDVEKKRQERSSLGKEFIKRETVFLHHSYGWETQRRNNLHRLGEAKLLTCAGSTVVILDLVTLEKEYLEGIDNGGIGAITVHPSGNYFAVGEKHVGGSPNVYIYEYPSLRLIRILKEGTERSFSDLRFDKTGEMLATVGGFPDYLLHVWDWKKEAVMLRAKAFSQEVFNVSFSDRFDGTLYTSGTGHIRFWKMAHTFTGLKLQGEIGKFGAIELSDISAYLELADGKVLTGSESGNLLLWDGGLIKVEIFTSKGQCHNGMIEMLWQQGDLIVSAGMDGFLRYWEYPKIDLAEPEEDEPRCTINPVKEFLITEGGKEERRVSVKTMHLDREGKFKEWLVQDDSGALWRIGTGQEELSASKIMSFHAGGIAGCEASPRGPFFATAGSDGSIRLHNLVDRKTVFQQTFPQACSCMMWGPLSVDEEGTMIAVGFEDGVVRMLKQLRDSWHLQSVSKPHTKRVNMVKFSPDGRKIASCSQDNTIFLQNVVKDEKEELKMEPIGFISCNSSVSCMSWSPDCESLLACIDPFTGSEGEIISFKLPPVEEINTSTTFDITSSCQQNKYNFERKIVLPEKPAKPKKEGEDQGEEPEEEEEPEPEPEVIPNGAPKSCLFMTDSSFLLSFDGPETRGVLYECSFDYKHPLQELTTHTSSIVFMRLSHSGRYLITGGSDGSVALRGIGEQLDSSLRLASKCWRGNLHGCDAAITGASISFDEEALVSSAVDGNVLQLRITEDFHASMAQVLAQDASALKEKELMAEAVRLEELKAQAEVAEEEKVEDIVDPKHYSIQQEKIQAEEDRRKAEAEKKKERVRETILQIREEFEQLVQANEALPPGERLDRDEFEVDPELRIILEKEAAEKVEEARKELAWESEKKSKALEKLRKAFIDNVAVEHIVLHALRSPYAVHSFRTPKLTQEQKDNIAAVHQLINQEERKESLAEGKEGAEGVATETGQATAGGAEEQDVRDLTAEELEEKGVSKQEIRKILRQQRQRKWEQLLAMKPDDKYEDPKDVSAIQHAQTHMGDYKLKTDEDYVVPEHLRIDAEKKRRQMVLLEESIHSIKMGFNDRLLALRDLKKRIISNIEADNQRIREIDAELGIPTGELWQPSILEQDEFPELRFTRGSKLPSLDIPQQETLKKHLGSETSSVVNQTSSMDTFRSSGTHSSVHETGGAGGGGGGGELSIDEYEMSELEQIEAHIRKVQLQYEKEKMIEKIEQTVQAYDEAIRNLRRERFKLEADIKMMDLRMLVLLQELQLLKEFEKRDNALVTKLNGKREEKADIASKIKECNDKIATKKHEIEKLNPKQVMMEFSQLVPDSNKFHEPLLKIFKKKIKRMKKKANEGEEDDEEGEDEDEDEDDMSDFDEEEEEEEEEEFCPPGCDPSLFEQVCELREKRLDQEEMLAEYQKGADQLKKDLDGLVKKEKIIDSALRQTEQEIQQFQTFKQQKLNEIRVVITLKMHQIKCLVEDKLPPDLSNTIVFTNSGLKRLRSRIDELKEEKEELRKNQKLLRKEHVNLLKSKKVKEERLRELEARSRDVQMLKFGQEVDLDVLEKMGVNKTAEELREQLKQLEKKNAKELRAWQKQIDQAAGELAGVTKQNTEKLERVAELTAAQHRLEKELNSTQSRMVAEVGPSKEKVKAEREQLVSLVKLQAREMEALKAEINMLRRKGGHVYTPVVRRAPPPSSGEQK